MKALFLMHEGVGDSIFESQVLGHCNSMFLHGVSFDVLTYDLFRKSWCASSRNRLKFASQLTGGDIILKKGLNLYIPFAAIVNAFLLIHFFCVSGRKYELIHARTEYSAFIAILAFPFHRRPIIWDCRGDSQDELSLAFENKSAFLAATLGTYCSLMNHLLLIVVARFAAGAVFVSYALLQKRSPKRLWVRSIVCPCVVESSSFGFDPTTRSRVRSEIGVPDGVSVILYSGSMVPYQCFDRVAMFFKEIAQSNKGVFFIVLTTQPDVAGQFLSGIEVSKLLIAKVDHNEVSSYLCAADYAVLFREARSLNFVASPTKFGEYSMAGLPVVTDKAVDQIESFGAIIGNTISKSDFDFSKVSNSRRVRFSKNSVALYSRAAYIDEYIQLYKKVGRR